MHFKGQGRLMKGQRRPNGGFDLAEAPSHLIRRCQQYHSDLYAREAGSCELTKQQFTVLAALENNEGVSQTALVGMTGIDRSTLAEMVRRMLDRGLVSRERTEADARANAVAITGNGRKGLRAARSAADRADRLLLDCLPPSERGKFIKSLSTIASAGEAFAANGSSKKRRKNRRRRG
jgi:DNA-binding MarR family transcriptional regulator